MTIISRRGLAIVAGALALSFNANAQERHYRFAHDQQLNSGYSVAYDIFSAKLKAIGIKIVPDVDKSGFSKISDPMLDKLAKELGPHADKIKTLIKSIQ